MLDHAIRLDQEQYRILGGAGVESQTLDGRNVSTIASEFWLPSN